MEVLCRQDLAVLDAIAALLWLVFGNLYDQVFVVSSLLNGHQLEVMCANEGVIFHDLLSISRPVIT